MELRPGSPHVRAEGWTAARYFVATRGSKAFDDPGMFVDLPLVNKIRPRVKTWREAGCAGVSGITKRLLEHWCDPGERRDRGDSAGHGRSCDYDLTGNASGRCREYGEKVLT